MTVAITSALSLMENPDDPRPDVCPQHNRRPVVGCAPCLAYQTWKQRQRRAAIRAGITPRVEAAPIAAHIEELAKHMPMLRLARRSGVSRSAIGQIVKGQSKTVYREVAEAILGVPVPPGPPSVAKVPAHATRRRVEALACDNWPREALVEKLGWSETTFNFWRTTDSVTGEVATAVAELVAKLDGEQGKGTTLTAARARNRGWLPFEAWPDDTIEDPNYEPRSPDPEPFRARRRLRALYYSGHGDRWITAELGKRIRVTEREVRRWTRSDGDEPIPRWVWRIVDPIYRAHARHVGPDQAAADYARARDWQSAVEWAEYDIDSPGRSGVRPPSRNPGQANPTIMHAAAGGGLIGIQLTAPERAAVVHYLAGLGRSPGQIGDLLRWAPTRAEGAAAVREVLAGPVDRAHVSEIRRLAGELAGQRRAERGVLAA